MRTDRIVFESLGLVGAGIIACATPRHAAAQVTTQVGVAAGKVTDERGVESRAVSLSPTLTVSPNRRVSLGLMGTATRFGAAEWALGGSVTVAARADVGRGAALSLNAGGGVSRSSFGATFTVADATPAVEWSLGSLTLFGGGRVATGVVHVRTETASPPAPIPVPGRTTLISVTRTSRGPVYGGVWQLPGWTAPSPLTLSYREERGVVENVTAIDRSAGATLTLGPVGVGTSVTERSGSGERTQYASASISWTIAPALSLQAVGGRYPSDRITGAAGGRFLSAGLVFQFDGGSRTALPVPRGAYPPAAGTTRLSIRAEDARTVDVFGDWNGWTPAPATRADNGVWYVDIPLVPGEYRYAFRINQVEWRVPDGAVSARDGFGGKSAYVTVERDAALNGTRSQEDA